MKLETKIQTFYSSQSSFVWDPVYKSKIVFIKCTHSVFFTNVIKLLKSFLHVSRTVLTT